MELESKQASNKNKIFKKDQLFLGYHVYINYVTCEFGDAPDKSADQTPLFLCHRWWLCGLVAEHLDAQVKCLN